MVENISIRCNNCGKVTDLSMKNIKTNSKDTVTKFVLNTLLHHVGMSSIIETNKQLEYYIEKIIHIG